MTKKDYIKIAAALRETRDIDTDTWSVIVTRISRICADDNPRFNRDRFFAACGVARS